MNNLSYAFIAQLASLLLSILTSLVVPKLLGIEEFSYWQLFIFYGDFVGFFHFGLTDGIYLRYGGIAYDKLNKTLVGSQFWLLVLIQLIISIVILVFAELYVVERERNFILSIIAIYLVVANMTWYLGYVFQATNKTQLYSASVIIDKVFFIMAITALLIMQEGRFQIFVLTYLVGKVFSLIYCIYKGREVLFAHQLEFYETIQEAWANMKIGINLTLSSIAGILILGSSRFFVDNVWGITAFGKFSFALSLTGFFLLFINQVSMVLFPMLRTFSKEQLNKCYHYISSALSLGLPAVLLIYLPIGYLMGLWLPQYQESFRYLALLLPLCVIDGKMQVLCNTYFKVLRKERMLLWLNVISMLLSAFLGLLGAYVLHNIYFIVVSMVVAVAFRSILSEIYLARLMNASVVIGLTQEIILVVIFMATSWYVSSLYSFFLFFIAYLIYIVINYKKVRMICNATQLFR